MNESVFNYKFFYADFDCVLTDVATITIGNNYRSAEVQSLIPVLLLVIMSLSDSGPSPWLIKIYQLIR